MSPTWCQTWELFCMIVPMWYSSLTNFQTNNQSCIILFYAGISEQLLAIWISGIGLRTIRRSPTRCAKAHSTSKIKSRKIRAIYSNIKNKLPFHDQTFFFFPLTYNIPIFMLFKLISIKFISLGFFFVCHIIPSNTLIETYAVW